MLENIHQRLCELLTSIVYHSINATRAKPVRIFVPVHLRKPLTGGIAETLFTIPLAWWYSDTVKISFDTGDEYEFTWTRDNPRVCEGCHGHGQEPGKETDCRKCTGSGVIYEVLV